MNLHPLDLNLVSSCANSSCLEAIFGFCFTARSSSVSALNTAFLFAPGGPC